jgi:hypothetical protein
MFMVKLLKLGSISSLLLLTFIPGLIDRLIPCSFTIDEFRPIMCNAMSQLTWSALGSAGLEEIVPLLYRNTSIKALVVTNNGLCESESANVLRELIRRNKTLTSLCLAHNFLVAMLPLFGALRMGYV